MDWNAVWPAVEAELPPASPEEQWPDITEAQLSTAAKKARGTAPGLDGWEASEICLLSPSML